MLGAGGGSWGQQGTEGPAPSPSLCPALPEPFVPRAAGGRGGGAAAPPTQNGGQQGGTPPSPPLGAALLL